MINLQKQSGLPIELKDDLRIQFNPPLVDQEPTFVRMFSQVVPVLKNSNVIPPAQELYVVYRKVHLPEHSELVESEHLEYDLTIIPPLMLGDEYNKTVGHYHVDIPGTDIAHPEVYEVIQGHALFIIQKMDADFKNVISTYAIEAKAGDKIIYPLNFGHVLINIGSDVLVAANWLSTKYKPMYEEVAKFHGMAYYVVKGENGFKFVKNPNYTNHPEVKLINEQERVYANFGFKPEEPMYTVGMENPKLLEFLNAPEKYLAPLSSLIS